MTIVSTRSVARGRALVLGAVVALACSACASKEKVASGPAGPMGAGMAPPPMTATYDPARQMAATASPGGSPYGFAGAGQPGGSADPSSMINR